MNVNIVTNCCLGCRHKEICKYYTNTQTQQYRMAKSDVDSVDNSNSSPIKAFVTLKCTYMQKLLDALNTDNSYCVNDVIATEKVIEGYKDTIIDSIKEM